MVPLDTLLMLKVRGAPASVGNSAVVPILHCFDLEREVLPVMERPLEEDVAKVLTDLDAAAWSRKKTYSRFSGRTSGFCSSFSRCSVERWFDFSLSLFPILLFCLCTAGTSAYAPPQFFTHGRYEATPTTVWQLGALLCEMLDGEQQFTTSKFLRGRIYFNSDPSQGEKMVE